MKKISLNDGWQFWQLPGGSIDCPPAPEGPAQTVTLPHTWYDDDAETPYRGLTRYRKALPIDPAWRGKALFLDIPGADNHAKVYLNGILSAEHKGGYSAFRVPVPAEALDADMLDIQIDLTNAVCDDISPLAGDFTIFGGLYRGVNLLVGECAHFDVCYYGTDGVLARTELDAAGRGLVHIEPHTVGAENGRVRYALTAPDGTPAAEQEAGTGESVTLTVEHPHLWNGKADPALYQLKAELLWGGAVTDTVCKNMGFRRIRMEADRGFFLNGEHLRLRGVAKHQDFAGKFNAVSEADIDRDFALIREVGANALRLSHYQHPQHTYDLCDREGYVVWAEVPMLKLTRSAALLENIRRQLTELVLQNLHHPSICFWGIQNEIGIYRDTPDMHEDLAGMRKLVNELDPGRLVTAANLYSVKFKSGLNHGTDMVGYNIYFGWYYGQMQDYDDFLDRFHAANPEMPLGISEYGVDANTALHSTEPKVQDYSEEYQALFHETVYPIFERKPYLWGSFVWNMFDFSSALRKDGGLRNLNGKGLVTYDRTTRKDAFYYYKARWSEEPFVHLCGKRFAKRTGEGMEVKFYTNQPEAALFVNGRAVGTRPNNGNGTVVFADVPLQMGQNTLRVTAGPCIDEAVFTRQETEEPSCRLPGNNAGGPVKNWFLTADTLTREGYCSVEDTANDLLLNPAAAAVLEEKLPQLYRVMTQQDAIPLGLGLKRLLSLSKVEPELVKELNAALNQIPAQD